MYFAHVPNIFAHVVGAQLQCLYVCPCGWFQVPMHIILAHVVGIKCQCLLFLLMWHHTHLQHISEHQPAGEPFNLP